MRVLKIIDTIKIGDNTLIAVNDPCEDIKKGSGLLDENEVPHVILSIATNSNKNNININININITNILVEGNIESKQVFI